MIISDGLYISLVKVGNDLYKLFVNSKKYVLDKDELNELIKYFEEVKE